MFAPAISPVDPKLMMLNCDMSGAYLSRDGGSHWRMIDQSQLRSSTHCRPAFHPWDARVIFAAQSRKGMKVSRDGGEHWQPVAGEEKGDSPHLGEAPGGRAPTEGWSRQMGTVPFFPLQELYGEIAVDPGHPQRMMAGDERSVVRSDDGGRTWRACQGPQGQTVAFHFDQTSPADRRICFAATSLGIWRSDDGGATWSEKTAGLPWKDIRSFAGGSRAEKGDSPHSGEAPGGRAPTKGSSRQMGTVPFFRRVVLYCVVPSRVEDGKFAGGVYKSADRGESWTSVMGGGINTEIAAADQWAQGSIAQYQWVLTTNVDPNIVYALNSNTGVRPPHHTAAYRSDDAGRTWRATFYPDPRFAGCNVEKDFVTATDGQFYQQPALGAAIDASNPDHLVQVNDWVYYSNDGGRRWNCGHARRAAGSSREPSWLCNGLVVTSTWNYYIDPFQPERHYIAYTDVGFARSLNAGKSWSWWSARGRAPWCNTCYELAFDPQTPGKIWGAFSDVHDIPNGNIIYGGHRSNLKGGVAVSSDFGATWKASAQGLPEAAAVSVVLDPKSPAGRRTLYASIFNHGVYKSTDDGRTWQSASQGLGSPADMRVCRLQLHKDGLLFVLVTAMMDSRRQFLKEGPGLYRSTDGARRWTLVNQGRRFFWPKDFTVDPDDSKTIYIGAADARADQAGLWRTADGGTTWQRLAKKGSEHFGAYLHPAHKGWIYMTLTEGAPAAGLWLSRDDGRSWKPMSLPFANAQRVCFDRADPSVIYVTTFGGSVWRGPAEED
jgi:photosystem II stability/assembly factor-like uncharacterized protein